MSEETQKNHTDIVQLDKRLSSHEAMCEERWKTCFNRLEGLDSGISRIESILIAFVGGALVATLGLLGTMLSMHY